MFALIYALIGILTKGFLYLTIFVIILFTAVFYFGMKSAEETDHPVQRYPTQYRPVQRRQQYIPKTRYRQAISLPRNTTDRKI